MFDSLSHRPELSVNVDDCFLSFLDVRAKTRNFSFSSRLIDTSSRVPFTNTFKNQQRTLEYNLRIVQRGNRVNKGNNNTLKDVHVFEIFLLSLDFQMCKGRREFVCI